MSFPLPVCESCGRAAFPPRALCPSCGGSAWRSEDAAGGVVEQVSDVSAVHVAAVRTDLGPVVVARAPASVRAGDEIELDPDGGVPVVRSA
ncbi:MAG TPA: zinc ribbon domain-containing protein [Gaiellaceae bacterium]|jgi:uncharacterized OB-fold protein